VKFLGIMYESNSSRNLGMYAFYVSVYGSIYSGFIQALKLLVLCISSLDVCLIKSIEAASNIELSIVRHPTYGTPPEFVYVPKLW
jgi:hypothetical protein